MNSKVIKYLFFWWVRYKKFIAIFVIIFIAFLSYKLLRKPDTPFFPEEKVVEIVRVKHHTIKQTVDVIGIVRSRQQTLLTAKSKGTLVLLSKAGQFLKKGNVIGKVDNKEVEQNYRILKEAEQIAQAQLSRANVLLKAGILSKNFIEGKKTALLEVQRKLSDAKISLEELKIYAPFDGILGLLKLREGSEVTIGDIIVNFYDPNSFLVEFNLPFSVVKQLGNGGRVFINNHEYNLTYVQKMLDEETHMCPAYVEIKCPDCISGTAIDVALTVTKKSDVIVIPFEAVFLKENKPFVYIVEDNKAILTSVELGIRDKKLIEIKSGLNIGDQVITQSPNRLYHYASVKINDQATNNAKDDLP